MFAGFKNRQRTQGRQNFVKLKIKGIVNMNKLLVVLALFSTGVFAAPVNINTADAKTIDAALSGVGIKKAEAIVADRTKNGAFKSADDLKRVSGIGEKTVAANKADILLADPVAGKAAAPAVPAKPVAAPAAVSAPAAPVSKK